MIRATVLLVMLFGLTPGNLLASRFLPSPPRNGHQAHPPQKANIDEGARLYTRACLACHGPRGNGEALVLLPNGQPSPGLDKLPKKVLDGEELIKRIRQGGGYMPTWGRVLSATQMKSLVLYIKSVNRQG